MDLTITQLVFVGLGAVFVGLAKAGVPGLGILLVLLLAMAFPDRTRQSVGVLLPMLIVGDIFAVIYYRGHAQWRRLVGLMPSVAVGLGLGWWYLAIVDESLFRPLLGCLILGLLVTELLRTRRGWDHLPRHRGIVAGTGLASGFATTVGNAAGPIMSIYLVSRGLLKQQFISTVAWFFFIINLIKAPIFVEQGMITRASLRLDLTMIPLVLLGAAIGVRVVHRIPQTLFNRLILIFSAVAALQLIVSSFRANAL